MKSEIEIVGAHTNNLKSIDVSFPLHKATMVVGVSGSGKSSLLADTLASEINTRMRRFLGVHQPHLESEDVTAFIGPTPAGIHFSQGAFRASRRTTVGTASGFLSLLRYYFKRYSKPWADEVKSFVPCPSPESYGNWIENHYTGPITVWTVMARWERTDGIRIAKKLRSRGINHARVRSETDTAARRENGREVDLGRFRPLSEKVKHLIEAEVGRTQVSGKSFELMSLLEAAFAMGGDVIAEFQDGKPLPAELQDDRGVLLDSTQHWVHPKVLRPFAPPSDALLSFNSPSNPRGGACRTCEGLGRVRTVLTDMLVLHPERSMHKGAFWLWTEKNYRHLNIQHETIEGLRGLRGFSPNLAWKGLPEDARDLILYGSGSEEVADVDPTTKRKVSTPRTFPGFIPSILRRGEGAGAAARALDSLITEGPCSECDGTRWSREALALRLGEWNLPSLLQIPFEELIKAATAGPVKKGLPPEARPLATGLHGYADAFYSAGLGHLSADRGMTTLSEGESRRSRLAALLRARGQGLALLLDEPARGLHEEDVVRLASALADLKKRHTLIINEHRISLAGVADHVLEIGPGAGEKGGRIVHSGPPSQVFTESWYPSISRDPLRVYKSGPWLAVKGAKLHTLSNIDCRIPLGRLTSITGVSGSGKSTFIRGILLPALLQAIPERVESEGFTWEGGDWKGITGIAKIHSVLALESRAPNRQRRSTVATLLGIADVVRRIFGKSKEAHIIGLTPSDFGLNAGRGRCQTCLGLGEIEDGESWVPCPHCGERCFGEEALSVRIEGLSVADLFELPISELMSHPFSDRAGWMQLLEQLFALDLGYLTLGRRTDRLSGGEHQRLRVARTLAVERPEGLLLVLDEPSAGLHPYDVSRLLAVLDRVVAGGRNTVVLVEHNLGLIRASDWVIDFGPGGGPGGGQIVGEGPPSRIAKRSTPTGRVLRKNIKLIKAKPNRRTTEVKGSMIESKDSPEDSARSGLQWLKRLLGEESSGVDLDPVDFADVKVMFDDKEAGLRPYEIGGLDIEIARILLDQPDDISKCPEQLARTWIETPEAQLQIHPLIEELRVWGDEIPCSILAEAERRLTRMGLGTNLPLSNGGRWGQMRATGQRFDLENGNLDERVRCVRDALGIGGGYVELALPDGKIIDTLEMRHVDFLIPAIAPRSPSSATLSRRHSAGSCLSCKGQGLVSAFDESLVIARMTADPISEKFLRPEALRILRGVRKSFLLPFFKRMVAEGLWPANSSFSKLESSQRNTILHGYWQRPGPGSFLKNAKAKPEDVSSWLRWNGLFRAVLDELDRSTDADWARKVEATTRSLKCTTCAGTGLQPQSKAIKLGKESFFNMVRGGTVNELISALKHVKPASDRSERTRSRVLHCLEPFALSRPNWPLRQALGEERLYRNLFDRTVSSMTSLKVIG